MAVHVAGMIKRSSGLMIQRPGDPRAGRKPQLLSDLTALYASGATEQAHTALAEALAQLEIRTLFTAATPCRNPSGRGAIGLCPELAGSACPVGLPIREGISDNSSRCSGVEFDNLAPS